MKCEKCSDTKQITVREICFITNNETIWKAGKDEIDEKFVMNNTIDIDEEATWSIDGMLLFIKMIRIINCPYCLKG